MSNKKNQEKDNEASSKKKIGRKPSKKEIDKIEGYLRDSEKLNTAIASSTTNKRRSPHARSMANGDIMALKRSIYNILWNKVSPDRREKIAKLVCEDWNYCENRSEIAEFISIIHVIVTIVKPVAIPVCVWVFVVKYRMFDELCNCSDRDLPVSFANWLKKSAKKTNKENL